MAYANEGDLKIADNQRCIKHERASCLPGITGDPLGSGPDLASRFSPGILVVEEKQRDLNRKKGLVKQVVSATNIAGNQQS